MSKEAMKLAMEALEWEEAQTAYPSRMMIEAITALREALAEQPAQRTWVGLTDEEFQWIYDHGRTPAGMMELVEAKLKEKNT